MSKQPPQHQTITIQSEGKEYTGSYKFDSKSKLITVFHQGKEVTTQLGREPEEFFARLLLVELVHKKQ